MSLSGRILPALSLPFLLAACGGGGGGGDRSLPATLSGVVLTRDGTTSDLGGMRLLLATTGQVATTRPDGSFDFGAVPTGTLALQVVSDARAASGPGGGDDDPPGDDRGGERDDDDDDSSGPGSGGDGDDDDVGDDDCDVDDVREGEALEIRIRVVAGEIVSLEVRRSHQERLRIDSRLERSTDSDDPDVVGYVRLESRDDRERFQVEAEHLDVGRRVETFVIDPSGVEESQGVRTVDAEGEAEWHLDSRDERLPFGVLAVSALEGHVVEVRDAEAGTVLLFGTIPEVPDLSTLPGGGGSDDEARGRNRLVRAAGVVGEAYVEVERKPDDGAIEEELEVEAEHLALPAGTLLDVLLEDPASPGTLVRIATLVVNAEGRAEVEFETDDGDALPFGAASVEALAGLDVEVRDAATGALLFSGEVPTLVAP